MKLQRAPLFDKLIRGLDCAYLYKQEVVPFEEKNRISGFLGINSCPVIYSRVIRKHIYNNYRVMHIIKTGSAQ